MVDFEKGTPAWDIGQILTRHAAGFWGAPVCAMVRNLRCTSGMVNQPSAAERLTQALGVGCDCGAGISDVERTSIIKPRISA